MTDEKLGKLVKVSIDELLDGAGWQAERTKRSLERAEIYTVGELIKRSGTQLLSVFGLGAKQLEAINSSLQRIDLSLQPDEPKPHSRPEYIRECVIETRKKIRCLRRTLRKWEAKANRLGLDTKQAA